jgi:hypothetical protein
MALPLPAMIGEERKGAPFLEAVVRLVAEAIDRVVTYSSRGLRKSFVLGCSGRLLHHV